MYYQCLNHHWYQIKKVFILLSLYRYKSTYRFWWYKCHWFFKNNIVNDVAELAKYSYEKDEKRKEEVKGPLLKDTVPFYMKKLDTHVKDNNGFLANGKVLLFHKNFTVWCILFVLKVVDIEVVFHDPVRVLKQVITIYILCELFSIFILTILASILYPYP